MGVTIRKYSEITCMSDGPMSHLAGRTRVRFEGKSRPVGRPICTSKSRPGRWPICTGNWGGTSSPPPPIMPCHHQQYPVGVWPLSNDHPHHPCHFTPHNPTHPIPLDTTQPRHITPHHQLPSQTLPSHATPHHPTCPLHLPATDPPREFSFSTGCFFFVPSNGCTMVLAIRFAV